MDYHNNYEYNNYGENIYNQIYTPPIPMLKNITINKNLLIRGIKILDIGWTTIAYFLIALGIIQLYNFINTKISGPFNLEKEKKRSTTSLLIDVLFKLWVMAIISYFVRNLFQLIPFPLDNFNNSGYQHLKVKEVMSGATFATYLILFNYNFQQQVIILKNRFDNVKNN